MFVPSTSNRSSLPSRKDTHRKRSRFRRKTNRLALLAAFFLLGAFSLYIVFIFLPFPETEAQYSISVDNGHTQGSRGTLHHGVAADLESSAQATLVPVAQQVVPKPTVQTQHKMEAQTNAVQSHAPPYLQRIEYKVQRGETLFSIAGRYYDRSKLQNMIASYNLIENPATDLKQGMVLTIPLPYELKAYVVQEGDTLYKITNEHFKFMDYVAFISELNDLEAFNRGVKTDQILQFITFSYAESAIDSPSVKSGHAVSSQLKGSFTGSGVQPYVVVDKAKNMLRVFEGDKEIYATSVATGKSQELTPTGTYQLVIKLKNPQYTPKKIEGGAPNNPLGTRWLGLDVPGTNGKKYGIHGTNQPELIGQYVSLGCIRMKNEDVEWLYEYLPVGTKVIIK